jgi:hypothetical protein
MTAKSKAAAALGALGGAKKSRRKTEANRKNILKRWRMVRERARLSKQIGEIQEKKA